MRAILSVLLVIFLPLSVTAESITVSAAISLKESLLQIGKAYEAASHEQLTFNFDASGRLAMQIQLGAPVDAFISADDEEMDKLISAGKVTKETHQVIVTNELVLIAPSDEKDAPKDFADFAIDRGKKISIGDPKSVPAGRYAMQTFKALKIDQAVMPRLVLGESVRQVLTYVEQNQVAAGVVYSTDAKQAGDKVKVIATAAANLHDKIEYPAGVVTNSAHPVAAQKFLVFLTTDEAKNIFLAHGFGIPTENATASRPTN